MTITDPEYVGEEDRQVAYVEDERPFERERFARGTDKLVKLDPLGLADWLVRVAPLATFDAAFDIEAVSGAAFEVVADGCIAHANRDAAELSGYDPSELVGKPIGHYLSGHGPGNTRLHRRDGREVSVELLVCPAANGAMIAMMRPRGDRDCSPTIGGVDVAEIVHDLKSPLSTIALEAAALRLRLDGSGVRDARVALARIGQNVDFMDRVIHDMLDVALIGAGHFAIHRRSVELVALVSDVVDRSVQARDRDRVAFHGGESILAVIDDLRIERVTANLLSNATKYSPRGSPIVVTVERLARTARVSVIDTGPGLSPDEALCVFDKYRRATSAGKHDGAGLGLYVSRKIVEAHGGRVGVERVGIGSRFYFELPVG
jgi:two-component system phosphate regulon sensor histidine kinase PhoR